MINNIIGQEKQVSQILDYLDNFEKGKALFLHGPPGVGKTFSVHEIAHEKGMEIYEVNASDKRTSSELENTAESASKQMSFFGKGKVILIDEVDNLSARGGISKLMQIIDNSAHPIILTANDPWKTKLRRLRKNCKMVEFKGLSLSELRRILSELTDNNELIDKAARNADGDARAAINNLCMPIQKMDKRITKKNVFQVMKNIFKSKGKEALYWINRLDMRFDDFKYWLLENISREIRDKKQVADAYEAVSRADLFLARARRTQNYSLMRYARIQLSLGVSSSNKNPYQGFTRYKSPSRIKKMMRTKSARRKIKQQAKKIAENCHLSEKKAKTHIIPYIDFISKKFSV